MGLGIMWCLRQVWLLMVIVLCTALGLGSRLATYLAVWGLVCSLKYVLRNMAITVLYLWRKPDSGISSICRGQQLRGTVSYHTNALFGEPGRESAGEEDTRRAQAFSDQVQQGAAKHTFWLERCCNLLRFEASMVEIWWSKTPRHIMGEALADLAAFASELASLLGVPRDGMCPPHRTALHRASTTHGAGLHSNRVPSHCHSKVLSKSTQLSAVGFDSEDDDLLRDVTEVDEDEGVDVGQETNASQLRDRFQSAPATQPCRPTGEPTTPSDAVNEPAKLLLTADGGAPGRMQSPLMGNPPPSPEVSSALPAGQHIASWPQPCCFAAATMSSTAGSPGLNWPMPPAGALQLAAQGGDAGVGAGAAPRSHRTLFNTKLQGEAFADDAAAVCTVQRVGGVAHSSSSQQGPCIAAGNMVATVSQLLQQQGPYMHAATCGSKAGHAVRPDDPLLHASGAAPASGAALPPSLRRSSSGAAHSAQQQSLPQPAHGRQLGARMGIGSGGGGSHGKSHVPPALLRSSTGGHGASAARAGHDALGRLAAPAAGSSLGSVGSNRSFTSATSSLSQQQQQHRPRYMRDTMASSAKRATE